MSVTNLSLYRLTKYKRLFQQAASCSDYESLMFLDENLVAAVSLVIDDKTVAADEIALHVQDILQTYKIITKHENYHCSNYQLH